MTNRSNAAKLIAVLMALAMLVAACGNDSDDSGDGGGGGGGGGDQGSGEGSSGSDFNQAQFEGEPRDGGSITFGVESEIASLDPCGNLAQPSDIVGALAIYDHLIDYDEEGNLTESLATSWKPNEDLTTWTFKLRDDVTFSDDTPFNAEAVKAHVERLQDPANGCANAPQVEQVTSMETPDPQTIVMKLNEPNSNLAFQFAGSLGFIESPTAVQESGQDFPRNPVGTGPFILEDFDSLSFSANPNYWRTDDQDRQLPYLDAMTLRPIPDASARLTAIQQGEVDIIQTATSNTIVDAQQAGDLNIQKVTGSSSTIVLFNLKKPPFDNLKLRRAFAHAINREELNQVQYEGTRVPAYTAFPPSSPYHSDAAEEAAPKYDPDKAKQLVDEVKADGEPTSGTGTCIPTPESRTVFGAVQEQLAAVGIDLETQFKDQGAFVNEVIGKTGNYQTACFRSPQAANTDALYNSLHSGGSGNVVFYSNDKVDKLLEGIRETQDTDEQIANLKQVQEIVVDDLPIIPLLFDLFGNIYRDNVSGLPVPETWSLGAIKPATLYLKQG